MNWYCDLLENSYLCKVFDNSAKGSHLHGSVVICLRILTFARSLTTVLSYRIALFPLWFAWEFLPLQGPWQRCDDNSRKKKVVICLRILTFARSLTTSWRCRVHRSSLWFAWEFLPLQGLWQRTRREDRAYLCCDLLENSYLCKVFDNTSTELEDWAYVVICLRILTFARSLTTWMPTGNLSGRLWFAWEFLPLQGLWQLSCSDVNAILSCDLLENSYLCKVFDNLLPAWITITRLWFAWEFLPLQGLWQLYLLQGLLRLCCDLLENSYLCKVFDNPFMWSKKRNVLWFAWEFLPLQGLWQHDVYLMFCLLGCDLLENSYLCKVFDNS